MTDKPPVSDWLPAHQEHLLYTLAHVDESIDRVCKVIFEYVRSEPLGLGNWVREGREEIVVTSVAPVPQSVPRDAANAINDLRNAIEHALSAEAEFLMGRALEATEAQAIEMPIPKSETALTDWFKHKRRRSLPVLHANGVLGKRIAQLQPLFESGEDSEHPLRVLAEHSNLSKHRRPAEYGLRLGRIIPDFDVVGLEELTYPDDRPMLVGDVLVSVPEGTRVPLDIWPTVGIRRPHSGKWIVLSHELRLLEVWVRTVALPTIIVGTSEVEPIPPHLDISHGYETHLDALASARSVPAAERLGLRLAGSVLRMDLPEILRFALPDESEEDIRRFASNLSDTAAVEILDRYTNIRRGRGDRSALAYLARIFEH